MRFQEYKEETETSIRDLTNKRVLISLEYPPGSDGGIQRTVLSFTEFLAQTGAEVDLVFPQKISFIKEDFLLIDPNVRTWPIATAANSWPLNKLPNMHEFNRVFIDITTGGLDSILVNSPDMLGLALIRRLSAEQRRLVNVIWNSPLDIRPSDLDRISAEEYAKYIATQPLYWLRKWLWMASGICNLNAVFNSQANKSAFEKVFPKAKPSKTAIVYPASKLCHNCQVERTDAKSIDESLENRFTILTTGRITRKKGIGRLLHFIPRFDQYLAESYPDRKAGFVIAGDAESPFGAFVKESVGSINLELKNTKVIVIERPTDRDLCRLYTNADMFFISSTIEGFGLVTVEAAAHGLPVIGFNARGSAELIPYFEQDGYLVDNPNVPMPYEDFVKLSQHITTFMRLDPASRATVSKRVKEVAISNFSPESTNQKMADYLFGAQRQ